MAGWVKKKEKRGKTNRGQHIHHTCTNYTEQSKLELSGLVGSAIPADQAPQVPTLVQVASY